MYSTIKYRHWKIVGSVIVAVGLGLSTFLGIATVRHINADSSYEDRQRAYTQQVNVNEMWEIIGGAAPAGSGQASYELLGERLSVVVAQAPAPADITAASYTAPPRTYRGIEDELGFDPFVSDLCNECGDLSQYMVERLRDIKANGPAGLIVDPGTEPIDDTGWALTALPFWLELFVVWQVFGALGMLWGLGRYGDTDLTWRYKDGKYSGLEWACTILAPVFMVVFLSTWNRRSNRRNEAARREMLRSTGLAEVLAKVEEHIAIIDRMPAVTRSQTEIQRLRARLETIHATILDMPDELRARQLGLYADRAAREAASSTAADDLLETAQKLYADFVKAIGEVNEVGFQG